MQVDLRDISRENWNDCVKLKVSPDQERFVASNAFSLCQANYEDGWRPMGVYDGDRMVGFIMFSRCRHPEWGYWIVRVMVDAEHQKKGYGRAALREALELLAAEPDCDEVFISQAFDNTVAERLYLSAGFEPTGRVVEGERVERYDLTRRRGA